LKITGLLLALLAATALATACGGETRPAVPTFPPGGSAAGKIAFVSDRQLVRHLDAVYGSGTTYLMNSDGSGLVSLAEEVRGIPSPDGKRFLFLQGVEVTGCCNYPPDIYVINADGSGRVKLTDHPVDDGIRPAWSPDGERIVFASMRDGDQGIYVVNADGSGLVNLTNNPAGDFAPAWSPDGKQIAFESNRDRNAEIYVMNADGSGQTDLTKNPASDIFGALDLTLLFSRPFVQLGEPWSPDGRQIAFASGCGDFLVCDIYVINADGTGLTNLTNHPATVGEWAWAPGGSRIAFESDRDGDPEIYVVNVDGSGLMNLTNNPAGDFAPAWSPDGKQIAFESDRDGNREIYVMNANGSNPINLSNYGGDDRLSSWLPGAR